MGLILPLLDKKQSSDVTVMLCLELSRSFVSSRQQVGWGGCWGQPVSVSKAIHCALWGPDWGYPLNNCSWCWNWFKVFKHVFFLPSIYRLQEAPSSERSLLSAPTSFFMSCYTAYPQTSSLRGVFPQPNEYMTHCVCFTLDGGIIQLKHLWYILSLLPAAKCSEQFHFLLDDFFSCLFRQFHFVEALCNTCEIQFVFKKCEFSK